MLYIFTNKDLITQREYHIDNIEEQFALNKQSILKLYEKNDYALKALREIEGMTYHDRDMIRAKFGSVSLDNISTGGKGCLLMALYHHKIALSTDEMGYNAIRFLVHIANNVDVYIYSSAPYTQFTDCNAYVNGELCKGEDDIIDFMEACYE